MEVLTKVKTLKRGCYTYELMATKGKATHLHINNHKTNKSSVIVRLDVINNFITTSSKEE